MSTALISALSVVSAAVISGAFAWMSHRGNAKVEQVAAVLDAYNEIVKNLQTELQRVQNELAHVRTEMRDCERRSTELKKELDEMKAQFKAMKPEPAATPRKRTPKAS